MKRPLGHVRTLSDFALSIINHEEWNQTGFYTLIILLLGQSGQEG